MSDTAVTPDNATASTETAPTDGFFLDGDAPRLGSAPILPPTPVGTPVDSDGSDAGPVSVASTPDEGRVATQLSEADLAALPTLAATTDEPKVATVEELVSETDEADESADHPMAHLMPPKSKPTEASLRAAAQRAEKKAKAKKIKIGVAAGALVVSAVVGPPLWSWLSNAVNEAGGTTTEPAE